MKNTDQNTMIFFSWNIFPLSIRWTLAKKHKAFWNQYRKPECEAGLLTAVSLNYEFTLGSKTAWQDTSLLTINPTSIPLKTKQHGILLPCIPNWKKNGNETGYLSCVPALKMIYTSNLFICIALRQWTLRVDGWRKIFPVQVLPSKSFRSIGILSHYWLMYSSQEAD